MVSIFVKETISPKYVVTAVFRSPHGMLAGVVKNKNIYYIQFNEITGKYARINEITCIFQKVILSLVTNIKSDNSLVKNINFWMTSAFSISFLCNSAVSLQNSRRFVEPHRAPFA